MSLLILTAAIAMATPTATDLRGAVLPRSNARTHEETLALHSIGIARTSVDTQITRGATGSLGFLCGRQPGQTDQGAAAAYGYDPSGRFVGAKLSIGF